jgi:hypothetical protein
MNKFILSGIVEDPGDTFFTILVDNQVRIPVEFLDCRVLLGCDFYTEGSFVEISGSIKCGYNKNIFVIEDLICITR